MFAFADQTHSASRLAAAEMYTPITNMNYEKVIRLDSKYVRPTFPPWWLHFYDLIDI